MTNNTKLSKTHVKIIAKDALREGRVMDAVLILTDRYDGKKFFSLESALHELEPMPIAKVGDILYTSWGYDQTNVDFFQVVRVKGTAVYIREVAQQIVENERTHYEVVAVRDQFIADETRHTVAKSYGSSAYSLSIKSFATAWVWDGTPKYVTGAAYGH